MADRTQNEIEEIKAIILAHQTWLTRRGGRRADLSFRDLSNLNLDRVNLNGAKLAGTNLVGARLIRADLSQADLFGADMEGANLTASTLIGADLRGANLHRAILTDANLRGADFRAGSLMNGTDDKPRSDGVTRLTEAKMERSILAGANFTGCDLSGADLNDADLTGADMTAAVLVGADFWGATLDGVTFDGTTIDEATLDRNYLPASLPENAIVKPAYKPMPSAAFLEAVAEHERWVNSQGAEGRHLDLDLVSVVGADLTGRVLAAARLRRCRLMGVRLRKASLEMADLSYTEMIGADLTEACLNGTNLRRAGLSRAVLARADARPARLSGDRPWPANFDGANLTGADLRDARMEDAVLRSAKLGGAKLDGTGITVAVDTAPPPPPVPEERRAQKRYAQPCLVVQTDRGAHSSRNWSIGGVSFYAPDDLFEEGETIEGRLSITGRDDVTATARMVVVHKGVGKGQVSVRFHQYGDDLKQLLKTAFLEHQKLEG
ncbi:pentapeptide repeat-containing protein [Azospirillum argentinense]